MTKFFYDRNFYIFTLLLIFHFSTFIPQNLQYYGFLVGTWIFSFYLFRTSNNLNSISIIKENIAVYTFPYLFAIAYTTFLILINQSEMSYLIRGLSITMKIISLALVSYALIMKYKTKTIDLLFVSFTVAYFVLTFEGVLHYGPLYILQSALNLSESRFEWSVEGSEFDHIFEVHEFGLVAPLIALYYLMSDCKWQKKIIYTSISLLIALICVKRIAIAALVCCFFVFLLCSFSIIKQLVIKFGGYIFIAVSYLFLIFIYSRQYEYYSMHFNIDMKGRDVFFHYFTRMIDFSPSFLGNGFDYVSRYLQEVNPFNGIMGVHNDILRLYIDLGYGALFVFLYLMFEYNRKVHMKIGDNAVFPFIICSLYCFITYFSDNTISYGLIQMTNALIPITMTYRNITRKKTRLKVYGNK